MLSRRVRAVRFPFRRWRFRPAARVWEEGYGNATDRAALLCACFEFLDVTACPVWTPEDASPLDEGLCVPSRLSGLWLEARTGEGDRWIPALGGGLDADWSGFFLRSEIAVQKK